ncbi:hypothetical protein SVAN01_06629 [Stagonosporopsis vannaccii]|nr:hypothetical protein SVAN01_06629 [Stagonosporopsis vannaccii]
MHSSQHTRIEAKKLFFSDPQAWYHVDAHWLLRGGYPAHSKYDLDFLACVEHLDVDFDWMYEGTWMAQEGSREWGGTEAEAVAMAFGGMDELIQDFWRTVSCRLPKLKHIILCDDKDRSEAPDDIQVPPLMYRKTENEEELWQRVNDKRSTNTITWQLCIDHPKPDVLPPYKVWRGPVGMHEDSYARFCDVAYQRKAIRVHRIPAMERSHFYGLHKPFICPAADCDALFEQPEEYTSHAIETKHDLIVQLPEYIESAFAENNKRFDRLAEIARDLERPFLEWWGNYGSEKRRVAEKELMYQLEHDPLYEQDRPVAEHPHLHALYRSVDGGDV